MSFKNYLVLSRIRIKDANALSSPITVGVPAITAFLGMAHKLQRKINDGKFKEVRITGVGIVIHEAKLQTYRGIFGDETIAYYRKPLQKLGKPASTIPEPRINMCLSLVCEVEDSDYQIDDNEQFLSEIDRIVVNELKIAGGDIIPPRIAGESQNSFLLTKQIRYFKSVDDSNPLENREIFRAVMPGYAIIERKDLLKTEMANRKEAVESLIDFLAIHHDCVANDDGTGAWSVGRKTCGWLVPISVGYQGLTNLDDVKNQRDPKYKHVFGENLVTLGEFRMVNSFHRVSDFTWRYETDLSESLFKCVCNGGN